MMLTDERLMQAHDTAIANGNTEAAAQIGAELRARMDANKPQGAMDTALGYQQTILDGLTVGLGDELNAVIPSAVEYGTNLVTGQDGGSIMDTYDRNVNRLAGVQQKTREEHPLSSVTTEAAAGVIPALLSSGASIPFQIANQQKGTVAKIVNQFFQDSPVKTKVAESLVNTGKTAGKGALYGAGAGYGYSDANGEQLVSDMVDTSSLGAALGAATHPVAKLAGSAINLGRGMMKNGYPSTALKQVDKSIQADGLPLTQVERRGEKLGDDSMLAESAGGETLAAADVVANSSGAANRIAQNRLNQRQQGQGERILESSNEMLGAEPNYYDTIDTLNTVKKEASAPLYKEAYRQDVQWSPELDRTLKTPAGQRALRSAETLAKNEGKPFVWHGKRAVSQNPATGEITYETQAPTMETLDLVKRAMDDNVYLNNANEFGVIKPTDKARAEASVVRRLRNELDRLNPKYKAARDTYGGFNELKRAMKNGENFAKNPADVTASQISDMNPSQRDAFRSGVAQSIKNTVENNRDNLDVTKKLFGNKASRDKLRAIFPDDKSFRQFKSKMLAEEVKFRTKAVLGGSPTVKRANQQQNLASDIAQGAPLKQSVLKSVGNKVFGGLDDATAKEMARILYETDPVKKQRLIDQMRNARYVNSLPSRGAAGAERLVRGAGLLGTAAIASEFDGDIFTQ